jgi:hypothetical protein
MDTTYGFPLIRDSPKSEMSRRRCDEGEGGPTPDTEMPPICSKRSEEAFVAHRIRQRYPNLIWKEKMRR